MSRQQQERATQSAHERGVKGMSHGMSPQERGKRGAEARWHKAHPEEGQVPEEEEHHSGGRNEPMSSQEKGKKGTSHGMSPHDRGVLGAQARWGKAHAREEGGGAEMAEEESKQRGG